MLAALVVWDATRVGRVPAPCRDQQPPGTIGLVLSGAPRLRRTRLAVSWYEQGRIARLVFSGAGHGGDSARHLARSAERLGVSTRNITSETRARSTVENFRYACALPAMHGAARIAIVTDRFHAYRAWQTGRRQCPARQFCTVTVPGDIPSSRRWSETRKLLGYQLLGYARLW